MALEIQSFDNSSTVSDWLIQASDLAVHVLEDLVSSPEAVIKLPLSGM